MLERALSFTPGMLSKIPSSRVMRTGSSPSWRSTRFRNVLQIIVEVTTTVAQILSTAALRVSRSACKAGYTIVQALLSTVFQPDVARTGRGQQRNEQAEPSEPSANERGLPGRLRRAG